MSERSATSSRLRARKNSFGIVTYEPDMSRSGKLEETGDIRGDGYESEQSVSSSTSSTPILDPVEAQERIQEFSRAERAERRRLHDETILRKCWTMTILATLGLVLLFVELEIAFVAPLKPLRFSAATETLKCFITVTTLMLLGSIYDYYNVVAMEERRKWHLVAHYSSPFENPRLRNKLIAELLVCSFHAVPFLGPATQHFRIPVNDKIYLFMFVRLYHFVRVVRNYTRVYNARSTIKRHSNNPGMQNMSFGSWLACKALFYERTVPFVCCLGTGGYMLACYCVYITEREVQPDLATGIVFYFTLITMSTVGYGDYSPDTAWGRLVAALAGVAGVFTFSIVVAVVTNQLALDDQEKFAVAWGRASKTVREERIAAVKYIQFQYREHLAHNPATRHLVSVPRPWIPEHTNLILMKKLRGARKDREQAEGRLYDSNNNEFLEIKLRLDTVESTNERMVKKFNRTLYVLARLEKKIDLMIGPEKAKEAAAAVKPMTHTHGFHKDATAGNNVMSITPASPASTTNIPSMSVSRMVPINETLAEARAPIIASPMSATVNSSRSVTPPSSLPMQQYLPSLPPTNEQDTPAAADDNAAGVGSTNTNTNTNTNINTDNNDSSKLNRSKANTKNDRRRRDRSDSSSRDSSSTSEEMGSIQTESSDERSYSGDSGSLDRTQDSSDSRERRRGYDDGSDEVFDFTVEGSVRDRLQFDRDRRESRMSVSSSYRGGYSSD